MKSLHRFAVITVSFSLAVAIAPAQQAPTGGHARKLVVLAHPAKNNARLEVTSPAFKDGGDIPFENTQYRGNHFPGLNWSAGPKETKSYVVVMQGELPKGDNTSIHLTLFNIPASVTSLAPDMITPPTGSTYGVNVRGESAPYSGPHTHTATKQRYDLQVLALDTVVDVTPKMGFAALEAAMDGHVLASGNIVGLTYMDPESPEAKSGGKQQERSTP